MPPAYVKPYVKRGKTDASDAEAICEAVTRPTMRFVPIKSAEQQAALALHRTRDLLVKQRTQLVNMIRGCWPSSVSRSARGHARMRLRFARAQLSAGEAPDVPALAGQGDREPWPSRSVDLQAQLASSSNVSFWPGTARTSWPGACDDPGCGPASLRRRWPPRSLTRPTSAPDASSPPGSASRRSSNF